MLVRPVGFRSTAARTLTEWRVTMSIPASVFRISSFDPSPARQLLPLRRGLGFDSLRVIIGLRLHP